MSVHWQEDGFSITYLCTKILNSDGLGVIDCDRFHTRKDNILGFVLTLAQESKPFKKPHYRSRRPSPERLQSTHLRQPSVSSLQMICQKHWAA